MIGDRINYERKKMGISLERLAELAGISFSTLKNIEYGGVGNPGILTIKPVAAALGISLDDIAAPSTREERLEALHLRRCRPLPTLKEIVEVNDNDYIPLPSASQD
jgi:transcriptional regulator with XRE-family HTH domain